MFKSTSTPKSSTNSTLKSKIIQESAELGREFSTKVQMIAENEKIFSQTVTFRKTIEQLKNTDIKIKDVPANTFKNCDNAIQTLINYSADKERSFYEGLKEIITIISKKNIVTYRDLNIISEYILNDTVAPIDISEEHKTLLKQIFGTPDGLIFAQIGDYDYIFNVIKQFFIKNNKTNFDMIDLLLASGIIKYDYSNKSIIKDDSISNKLEELFTEEYITEENKDELLILIQNFDTTKIDELLNQ